MLRPRAHVLAALGGSSERLTRRESCRQVGPVLRTWKLNIGGDPTNDDARMSGLDEAVVNTSTGSDVARALHLS